MLSKTKFAQIIGANVRKARIEKGMTQDELAHECGFYRTYINLIETSKRMPSSYTLYKISIGLDVEIKKLYETK